jgi:hypothetical protein
MGTNSLAGRLEWKKPLIKPRQRWKDNIKMDLKEIVWLKTVTSSRILQTRNWSFGVHKGRGLPWPAGRLIGLCSMELGVWTAVWINNVRETVISCDQHSGSVMSKLIAGNLSIRHTASAFIQRRGSRLAGLWWGWRLNSETIRPAEDDDQLGFQTDMYGDTVNLFVTFVWHWLVPYFI